MFTIERLSTDNLREGVFCPHGDAGGGEHEEAMHEQLGAWLSGDMLKGHVARTESGDFAGFILYYPVDVAPIEVLGEGFYVIQCIYVKPEAEGTGIGKALVDAAIRDARGHGASGIAVTAYSAVQREGFEFMPSEFFERLGFSEVDQKGTASLLFARFRDDAPVPWFAPINFQPPVGEDRVRVDVLDCRRCYVGNKTIKLIDKIAESVGEKIEVRHHDQGSRPAVVDKGMSSGVFINGELTFFGEPISEDDMMRALEVALEAYETRTDRPAEA